MAPATAHFESDDSGQTVCRGAMMIRTIERWQQECPEAAITMTASLDSQALRHSKNIPEPRLDVISGFPNPALATHRLKRQDPDSMQPQADVDGSRFLHFDQRRQLAATWQKSARAQATFHTSSDHEKKYANGPVQLIPMPSALLSCLLLFPLRGQEPCQKRVGIPDRGR